MQNRIQILDSISEEGLSLFSGNYKIGKKISAPDGILVRSSKVDTDDYPGLLAVARAGVGVNNISVDKATERGICVFNAPGANANAVAELVFIMMGFAARNIGPSLRFCESLEAADLKSLMKQVESGKKQFRGVELAGKTLGVIGLGQVGVRVANYGIHHGMAVRAFDPFPTIQNIHLLTPAVEICRNMEEILLNSDVISVHVPLTPQTRHLIARRELLRVRKGCFLVNFAREDIVDSTAVPGALKKGRLGFYITDFPVGELLGNPRVITTPHLGASTAESEEKCAIMAATRLKNYLDTGIVENSVNFPVIQALPQQSTVSRLIVINLDVPNMIAGMTGIIGEAGLNIQSLLNESNGVVGYNIIDFSCKIPHNIVRDVEKIKDVIRVRLLPIK